jgi:hypothetical protein
MYPLKPVKGTEAETYASKPGHPLALASAGARRTVNGSVAA